MTNPLAPVGSPMSLEKQAYDAIKAALLTFRLPPGDSLVETDLARQLGISKTPVRDALSRLEKEGFIEKIPYKGYRVVEISIDAMEEIFEIRAVLEGLSARQATINFRSEDIQQAENLIAHHREALEAKNYPQAGVFNSRFHSLLLERSGNRFLKQILANLDDHLQRYRVLSNFQVGRKLKSVEEHRQVLAAIKARDAEQAEQAIREHLTSMLQDLKAQDFSELIERVQSQPVEAPDTRLVE